MAQLHILGSGTCHPTRGRKRRAHPGFFLRWGNGGDQHILFDVSAGIAERLEDQCGVEAHQVRHLAISHEHPDHFALPQFLQAAACSGMTAPGFSWEAPGNWPWVQIYAPDNTLDSIDALNRIHFPGTVKNGSAGLPFPTVDRCYLFDAGDSPVSWQIAGAELEAHKVYHDFGESDAVAFRVHLPNGKIFAYSGDTGLCEGILRAAGDAHTFVCEASARIGDETSAERYGHLNPKQAGIVARACRVKHLVLTHYSGLDPDDEIINNCRESGFEGTITVAKDGEVITV